MPHDAFEQPARVHAKGGGRRRVRGVPDTSRCSGRVAGQWRRRRSLRHHLCAHSARLLLPSARSAAAPGRHPPFQSLAMRFRGPCLSCESEVARAARPHALHRTATQRAVLAWRRRGACFRRHLPACPGQVALHRVAGPPPAFLPPARCVYL